MCLLLRMLEHSKRNAYSKNINEMSTDEKVDCQSCEITMSKKQRKRLLKSQRLKETRPQWRYQLYAPALKIILQQRRAEQRAKEKEKKRKRKLEGYIYTCNVKQILCEEIQGSYQLLLSVVECQMIVPAVLKLPLTYHMMK